MVEVHTCIWFISLLNLVMCVVVCVKSSTQHVEGRNVNLTLSWLSDGFEASGLLVLFIQETL